MKEAQCPAKEKVSELEPSLPVPEESPQVVRRVTATLLVDKWIELKPNCNILPKG